MQIRHAVRENRLSDPGSVTAADVAAFIARAPVWVWEEAGTVQGFSAADLADGSIWALFVDPDHEGRGIGRALLARACASLREAGHTAATLSTGPGTRAERFYRAAGWRAAGRKPDGEVMFETPL
jgi:GNAT superfamily N-acetyltransferase